MMSDKFLQQVRANSKQILKGGPLGSRYAPLPVVKRSGATMEAIKAYILSHNLGPGSPLPTEADLCTELGVSRSSVREALRKLEALDIVEVKQGRGTFVGTMSLMPMVETMILGASLHASDSAVPLRDVISLRKYLDLGMSADVVAGFEGKKHPELHDVVDSMVAKAQAHERFLEEDAAFHTSMMEVVSNTVAEQLVSALWLVHMVVVPTLTSVEDTDEDFIVTALAHRSILESAESGDLRGYREAVRAHYHPLEDMLALHESESE